MAARILETERIATANMECDHIKCKRTWGTQLRESGLILHLCNKHGSELLATRSDRTGKSQTACVKEILGT